MRLKRQLEPPRCYHLRGREVLFNGLDLDWVQAPDDHPAAGDRTAFGPEFMGLMSRIMTFPCQQYAL